MQKESRLLRVGVLGAGPIAQAAHFEACRKARNAELYAICDASADAAGGDGRDPRPQVTFADYDAMLADPAVEAVIVAIADQFHVARCRQGDRRRQARAGREADGRERSRNADARRAVAAARPRAASRQQCGASTRVSPRAASSSARSSARCCRCSAWYCDSTHRYAMTDDAPAADRRRRARPCAPAGDPKADGAATAARPRQPPGRHGALPVRGDRQPCGRSWPSAAGASAGFSASASPTAPSATSISPWPRGWTGSKGSSSRASAAAVTGRSFQPWYLRSERGRVLLGQGPAVSPAARRGCLQL